MSVALNSRASGARLALSELFLTSCSSVLLDVAVTAVSVADQVSMTNLFYFRSHSFIQRAVASRKTKPRNI